MRYRPCFIGYYIVHTMDSKTGRETVNTRRFYQASARSLDSCGHAHRTYAAAEPCLKKLKKAWSKWRSEVSKRAWEERRGPRPNLRRATETVPQN